MYLQNSHFNGNLECSDAPNQCIICHFFVFLVWMWFNVRKSREKDVKWLGYQDEHKLGAMLFMVNTIASMLLGHPECCIVSVSVWLNFSQWNKRKNSELILDLTVNYIDLALHYFLWWSHFKVAALFKSSCVNNHRNEKAVCKQCSKPSCSFLKGHKIWLSYLYCTNEILQLMQM